ncbi:hypothetical protein BVY04_02250 [bacterium M21]|nr:hypothetical protein BVY04_02250 [bacterium M21]
MKVSTILNSYITKNLLVALVMTIFIATFVGTIGIVGKIIRLIGQGDLNIQMILMFIVYNLPKLMCYTLPIGLLVATVLVFNRMSADNELTALRASGISLLQVCAPVVLLAIVISGGAWYLQFELSPNYTAQARMIAKEQGVSNPVMLLEPNKPIDIFDNFYILIGGKEENRITDVHIYLQDPDTGDLTQNITAQSGAITVDTVTQTLHLTLYNATLIHISGGKGLDGEPTEEGRRQHMFLKEWKQPFNYGKALNSKRVVRKAKEMGMKQLMAWVVMATAGGGHVAHYKLDTFLVELHKRAAWALSPFTFILIGIPMGLQIARRETSAGLIGAVVIAALYYIPMVLFSETMKPTFVVPAVNWTLHSWYFMWALNFSLQGIGLVLLWRRR